MTAPADLVVTQLSVEVGEAQESADFVTVSRPAGLWPLRRRTDQFCALLAPDRPGQGALCRQILDVMEREFAASGGRSATSALAAVLLAGHQFLRRENSLSMPEDRVRLHVAAAVLRSGGAYLGRVGPTFAAVRHRGVLQRFMGVPTPNGVVDPSEGVRPLGGEFDPQIAYAFSPFGPDDLLVLASGPQWERLRPDYIEAAMDEGEPSAVASALYELAVWRQTRPTFSILVLEARAPERRGWLPRIGAPAAEDEEEDEYAEAAPRGTRGAVRTYRPGRTARDRDYAEEREYEEGGYPGEHPFADERTAWAEGRRAGRRRGAAAYGETEVPPRGRIGIASGRRRGAATYGEEEGYEPANLAVAGTGGVSERARAAFEQLKGATLATLPPRALLVALIALALGVLLVLGATLLQKLQPAPDEAAAQAQQAQSAYKAYNEGRPAPEAPGPRDRLQEARQRLTSALALREDSTWRSLLGDIQAELDRVDRVRRLPATPALTIDLSGLGAETSVTRVIAEGTDLYVLDVGGARLLRYQLQADGTLQSGEPTVLVKRGDQVAGRVAGGLITMAWVPAGGPRTDPGLVVVESGRTFITYNPRAGLGRIVPADNVRWNAIVAMAAHQGNVYLVDPERQSVMEYRPTRNGYDSPPFAALDGRAGLTWDRVVDIAVDGNIYVLQGDGVLRKYAREQGGPQPFEGKPPDGLRGPIALTPAASGDARPLYVADMGNERIIEFAADGSYLRQFRPPLDSNAFQGLRDVFVDANNRLYVLTSKGLYRYELPSE